MWERMEAIYARGGECPVRGSAQRRRLPVVREQAWRRRRHRPILRDKTSDGRKHTGLIANDWGKLCAQFREKKRSTLFLRMYDCVHKSPFFFLRDGRLRQKACHVKKFFFRG